MNKNLQKVIIDGYDNEPKELNSYLENGWQFVSITPLRPVGISTDGRAMVLI